MQTLAIYNALITNFGGANLLYGPFPVNIKLLTVTHMIRDLASFYSELSNTIEKIDRLLIVIKGSPDPDVIASSFALQLMCIDKKTPCDIVALMELSLPQNRFLVQSIGVPIIFSLEEIHFEKYSGYAVLDHQSSSVDEISSNLPCLIHIDHHVSDDSMEVLFTYKTEIVGAVSTLFALSIEKIAPALESHTLKKMATALHYGIKVDTDNFTHSTDLDMQAITVLSQYIDYGMLSALEEIPFSDETITIINKAEINAFRYKDWLICGVGYISESFRDSIAVTADYLLSNEDVHSVIVFAVIEGLSGHTLFLDASVRTAKASLDLNAFIKHFAAKGGARTYKGAFQVNLDYFSFYPNRQALWDIIKETTLLNIQHTIDNIPKIIMESIARKIQRRIRRLFG